MVNLKLQPFDRQRFFKVSATFLKTQKVFCSNKPFSQKKGLKRIHVKSGGKIVLLTAHGKSFMNQSQGL